MTMASHQQSIKPGKRLVLFFDGTWNEPPDHTNVRRLRLMLAERSPEGIEQRAFYNAGVGTRWYDRLSGGLIGTGLSENVRDWPASIISFVGDFHFFRSWAVINGLTVTQSAAEGGSSAGGFLVP